MNVGDFPNYMTAQRRWMVRPTSDARAKLPQSPLEEEPEGYIGTKNWKYAWNAPTVWGTFEQAIVHWSQNTKEVAGFCYVLHPVGDESEALRLVCLDFDKALFVEWGQTMDPKVREVIDKLGTFVEYSVSGFGLHAFVLVRCKPFKNALQRTIGDCKVDILCSSQVAVTGQQFMEFDTLREVPQSFIAALGLKAKEKVSSDIPADLWDNETFEVSTNLIEHMANWEPCYRSSKGSQLGEGGDVEMYRAACHLARHGVTGWPAVRLLEMVPADPTFSEEELRHKVECAFKSVQLDEEDFGSESADNEFGIVIPDKETDEEMFGFKPISLIELEGMDLDIVYAVDKLLVDGEGLFIGGREKCFKTGIGADLALSLATGKPFLNEFEVLSEPKKVAFFTAEIGLRAAKSLFNRIRRAKGLDPGVVDNIDIIDHLPTFQLNPNTGKAIDPRAMLGLRKYFDLRTPDVAIFDPLYLAMTGATVGDMYAIGGVLKHMAVICAKYNVWPIFCHHARKDQTKEYQPMELGDMYGSGVSAFARQWLLLSHAEPFEDGLASLYCKAGGSAAGDCGLWRVNIEEGHADELLDRKWGIKVTRDGAGGSSGSEEKIMQALHYYGVPETVASIAAYAELDQSITKKTLMILVKDHRADISNNKYMISSEEKEDDNVERQEDEEEAQDF